jgi:hypothetical protein
MKPKLLYLALTWIPSDAPILYYFSSLVCSLFSVPKNVSVRLSRTQFNYHQLANWPLTKTGPSE